MHLPEIKVPEWRGDDALSFAQEVLPAYRPVVLKGIVKSWPMVAAAQASPRQASQYLAQFYNGTPVEAFVGPPEIRGRFFFRSDMSGFNFEKRQAGMIDVVEHLAVNVEAENRPALYVGAASIPDCLPGFEAENPLPLTAGKKAVPRIWIGNDISVTTHYDLSDNIACVAAGRRRFILFPPDQLNNLYVGPLDRTMAGQPASMVSVHEPDFERYPRFREALAAAQVAELEAGDAIYVPPLWWHHVDSLSSFNILVNYWWDEAPADAGSPFECLAHGLLTISHLPEARREAWRTLFDHYVFRKNGDPAAHLAPEHRSILGESTPQLRARIKQFVLQALTRR
jgi:hypothetical protein